MRRRLFAVTQHGQPVCLGPRQRIGRHRARRGGADRGDLACVRDAHRRAAVGVEQHHHALMRLAPPFDIAAEVSREHADQLGPERPIRRHRPGHDPEQSPLAERNDGPQQLPRLPGRKGDHRLTHDGDAEFVG